MYFQVKNILKNNSYYYAKHTLFEKKPVSFNLFLYNVSLIIHVCKLRL